MDGLLTLVIVLLELRYGGESLLQFQPFRMKSIITVYQSMLKTADYSLALVIIALCYAMLLVFGMTSPFIIEHVFNDSPVVAGYCALLSGVSLMAGGILSKSMIKKPLTRKIIVAMGLQLLLAVSMMLASAYTANLYTLMVFVLGIHLIAGFIFNNVFSYCLGRFSKNAGIASGITGGSMYILSAFFSYSLVNIISIKSQFLLGAAYLVLGILLLVFFALFYKSTCPAGRLSFSKLAS